MGEYVIPKTDAGVDRVIQLLQPAIDALRRQKLLTRIRKTNSVMVHLREHGKTRIDKCTFVFNPAVNTNDQRVGERYSLTSISDSWDRIIKRAQIRHRNAYQSRHTYACWSLSAGANPAFIAKQMGHASAQMIFTVYGSWMVENNADQVALLNAKLNDNFAPHMPRNHNIKLANPDK